MADSIDSIPSTDMPNEDTARGRLQASDRVEAEARIDVNDVAAASPIGQPVAGGETCSS